MLYKLSIIIGVLSLVPTSSFTVDHQLSTINSKSFGSSSSSRQNQKYETISRTRLFDSPPIDVVTDQDFEDEEEVEPGKMRVSEIKAELDIRGIDYSDCFDKESLSERLREARATGKADPSIIDKFNKAKLEQTFNEQKIEVQDEVLERAVANDGTLPGGMNPEMFKKLMGNPEIMALLQSTKMQEAMKLMMTGGREKLDEAIRRDPEMQETVKKLDQILGSL